VAEPAFLSHSLTAKGPNLAPSVAPKRVVKSLKFPTVMGTKAGP
jgi:hypothetical protein